MKNATEFSPRSAASLRREAALREQQSHIEAQIGIAERDLAEEKKGRDWCQTAIAKGRGGQGNVVANLDAHLLEIKGLTLRLETLAGMKKNTEANVEAECMVPPNRAGLQAEMASQARKRLELDTAIEKMLEGLRTALARREERTREMKAIAEQIEFSGDFDEQRFTALGAALDPILPESERRVAQFTGVESKGLVRAIARTVFEIPETLHCSCRCEPGDALLLTEEQFAAFTQSTYGLTAHDIEFADKLRDHFTPRRAVSAEQHERDKSAAEQAGVSVKDFWRSEDQREFEAAEKQRVLEYQRICWDNTLEHVRSMNGIPLEAALRQTERQYGARP